MLTPEQLEMRARGLGASDVAAVLGVKNPGQRDIGSTWARKYGGPNLERAPYVVEDGVEPETCDAFAPYIQGDPRTAGSILEAGLADIYTHMTGLPCRKVGTQRSAEYPWALATPDRIVGPDLSPAVPTDGPEAWREWLSAGVDRGLELKLVGSWSARDWPHEGVADHVRLQCLWSMFVTGLPRWDVFALVGGSEPRIVRIERDDAMIASIVDVCRLFWEEYVLADKPPPPPTAQAALELAKAIWQTDNGLELERNDPEIEGAVMALVQAQRRQKAAEADVDHFKALLGMACGPYRSIAGPWGRFDFRSERGRVSWKNVALELAGGVLPEALLDRHRGEGTRKPQLYPHKKWLARRLAELPSVPPELAAAVEGAEQE